MERASCPSRTASWIKRNGVLLSLVLLGLLGLLLALINFLEPCTNQAVTVIKNTTEVELIDNGNITYTFQPPVVVHVSMDESGSTSNFWGTITNSMVLFLNTLKDIFEKSEEKETNLPGYTVDFGIGASKWSNNPSEEVSPLTFTFNDALTRVRDAQHGGGGTAVSTALARCIQQFFFSDPPVTYDPDSALLCLVLSDGISYDGFNIFTPEKTTQNYRTECVNLSPFDEEQCNSTIEREAAALVIEQCNNLNFGQRGLECTTANLAKELKDRKVIISGFYVNDDAGGIEILYKLTSCTEEFNIGTANNCPYFSSALPADIELAATNLATTLAGTVEEKNVTQQNVTRIENIVLKPETTTICAGNGIWFFFLILFIPLGVYLFWRPISLFLAKYCCPPKPVAEPVLEEPLVAHQSYVPAPEKFERVSIEVPDEPEQAIEPEVAPVPVLQEVLVDEEEDLPEPNTLVKSKRYKWSIKAADAYLWNLGGAGVAPLAVNFGGVAPPSAPKQEAKEENMKRRTQRISLRWSYVPPPEDVERGSVRKSRKSRPVSSRVTSAIYDAVMPQWEPPERLEPFQEDEIQPGDIDYEYTMCLMRFCPCLRPYDNNNTNKMVPTEGKIIHSQSPSDSDGSMGTINAGEGSFSNPKYEEDRLSDNFNSSYYKIPPSMGSQATLQSEMSFSSAQSAHGKIPPSMGSRATLQSEVSFNSTHSVHGKVPEDIDV